MTDFFLPLLPGAYYHVFNRGNNRENVFVQSRNTIYFLHKYAHYLGPVVDTYAYCLLPNHFHFLVRVKTAAEICSSNLAGLSDLPGLRDLEGLRNEDVGAVVSNRFRLLFMSYAKAINKQQGRVGSLFQKSFKRLIVPDDDYRRRLVLYIHANPQVHGLCQRFDDWLDSSYHALLSDRPTRLCRDEVLRWMGGREALVQRQQGYVDWKTSRFWPIEED